MNALKQIYRNVVDALKVVYSVVAFPFTMAKQELQGSRESSGGLVWAATRILIWSAILIAPFFLAAPFALVAVLVCLACVDLAVTLCLLATVSAFSQISVVVLRETANGVLSSTAAALTELAS